MIRTLNEASSSEENDLVNDNRSDNLSSRLEENLREYQNNEKT